MSRSGRFQSHLDVKDKDEPERFQMNFTSLTGLETWTTASIIEDDYKRKLALGREDVKKLVTANHYLSLTASQSCVQGTSRARGHQSGYAVFLLVHHLFPTVKQENGRGNRL